MDSSNHEHGAYFYDGEQAVRHHAICAFTLDALHITLPETKKKLIWRYEEIEIVEKWESHRAASIGVRDGNMRLLIDDPKMFAELKAKLSTKKIQLHLLTWLPVLAFSAVIFGFLFMFAPKIAHALLDYIPAKYDEKISEAISETYTPCSQPVEEKIIEKITTQLSTATSSPYHYHVKLVDNEEVNAFSLPGGFIFIYRGAIEKMTSQEELAGVIAHEMGHIEHRHGLSQTLLYWITEPVLLVFTGGSSMASSFFLNHYSRDQENEADLFALNALYKTNISANGLADFLEKAEGGESKMKKELSKNLSYFSTHPATAERIELLRQSPTPENSSPILNESEWGAVKQACGKGKEE